MKRKEFPNKRSEMSKEISKKEIDAEVTDISHEGIDIGEEYNDRVCNAEKVSDTLKKLEDTVVEGKESRLQANEGYSKESQKLQDEGEEDEQKFNEANEIPQENLSEKIYIEDENERKLADSMGYVNAAGFDESFIDDKIKDISQNKEEFDENIKEISEINRKLNENNQETFKRLRDAVNNLE